VKIKTVAHKRALHFSIVLALVSSLLSFVATPAKAAPATRPGPPTGVTATRDGTTASVTFTAPESNGGSAILSYTATSIPGGITGTLMGPNSGTITITGLTASASYTFNVVATNIVDDSFAESSNVVQGDLYDSNTGNGTVPCINDGAVTGSGFFTIANNHVISSANCRGRVVIPEGVTDIDAQAFQYAHHLSSLVISNTVRSIGAYAFEEALLLTSLVIPDSVTSIGASAFAYAESLVSLTIGNSVTSISDFAFDNADSLISLTIGNGVTSIGASAFRGATSLTSLTIPANVRSIGVSAFEGATSLSSLSLQNGVTSIGYGAFLGASALGSITIPNSVEVIEAYAFSGADSLSYVNFESESNLEVIGGGAFQSTSLKSITIPSTVTLIGIGAFQDTSLRTVTILSTSIGIESLTFRNSNFLSSIYIPSNSFDVEVGSNAFQGIAEGAKVFVNDQETFGATGSVWNGLTVQLGGFTTPLPLYRIWQAPLTTPVIGLPEVGQTVYASAFERYLSDNLIKPNATFPPLEEYVYRITKEPNELATSVDHQSDSGYDSLSSTEQEDWYESLGFDDNNPYEFTWIAFMCVAYTGETFTLTASKPTGISYSYASREDGIVSETILNTEHNVMFKGAAEDWMGQGRGAAQTTRSAVGYLAQVDDVADYTGILLGDAAEFDINAERPYRGYMWGFMDVNASCGEGETLKALRIVGVDQNSPITSKGFSIPTTLKLADQGGDVVSVSPEGITIGVTGGVLAPAGFNAALWGLTTIAAADTGEAPAFTLSSPSITATVGSPITSYSITSTGGTIASYSISPALNNGTLSLDTSTGRLTGTPTTAASARTYTITATNATSTATRTFSLMIVASPAPVVVYVPVPVPFLTTLTNPKLNLANGKLICSAGTYKAGYTLDGVIQGNTPALFSPTSFTYNLLINGVSQTKFTTTSTLSTATWDLPAASSGSLFTCSISVTANTVTNTNGSNSDSSLVSAALNAQAQSVSLAEGNYNTAVNKNLMAYKQSLVDNRAKWRKEIETTRADYSATLVRIKAEGNSRKATSDRSAALKIMVAAQKKSAADYKASGPAALEAKKSADQAALEAKTLAIAKANATYGTFIESIGYGVLIP
jgi:hypothetical protein